DRLSALAAAGAQREPGEDGNVVVPRDARATPWAARGRRQQALAVRHPRDDDVEEAAEARADHQHVGVGDPAWSDHALGAVVPRARCTNRLSSVCRWGATETSTPPAPTIARIASCAGASELKVSTSAPSRRIPCAPLLSSRCDSGSGTSRATISTARTPGASSVESVPQSVSLPPTMM